MPADKTIIYLLLALTLVRGIIYASVIPPWQAPDEPPQFERAKAALSSAEWNSTSENNPPGWYNELNRSLFIFEMWNFLDASHPDYSPDTPLNRYIVLYQELYKGLYGNRLAYAVIGWPLILARYQPITLQLYLVRLNTVLMNMGIILLAFLITRTIFPNSIFMTLGVPSLILFNPQHTHLLSTVNSGNLVELLTTAALYFMVKGTVNGFSWLNISIMLLLSVAGMWTKATAYFLFFTIIAISLIYLWKYRRKWQLLLPAGLATAGLLYLLTPMRLYIEITNFIHSLQKGDFYLDPIVPVDIFISFWAAPGWVILRLHPFWYIVLAAVCTLSAAGLLTVLINKRHLLTSVQKKPQIFALTVLAVATTASIGIILGWDTVRNSIIYRQGRSIYPVIVPISIFLMLGWRQLIPHKWQGTGLLTIITVLFLFDMMVLFHNIIPFFYSRY